jgi:hypothetical protein
MMELFHLTGSFFLGIFFGVCLMCVVYIDRSGEDGEHE